MEIVSLLPLSRTEIQGKKPNLLQAAFGGKLRKPVDPLIGKDLVHSVLTGGYPEMLRRGEIQSGARYGHAITSEPSCNGMCAKFPTWRNSTKCRG